MWYVGCLQKRIGHFPMKKSLHIAHNPRVIGRNLVKDSDITGLFGWIHIIEQYRGNICIQMGGYFSSFLTIQFVSVIHIIYLSVLYIGLVYFWRSSPTKA